MLSFSLVFEPFWKVPSNFSQFLTGFWWLATIKVEQYFTPTHQLAHQPTNSLTNPLTQWMFLNYNVKSYTKLQTIYNDTCILNYFRNHKKLRENVTIALFAEIYIERIYHFFGSQIWKTQVFHSTRVSWKNFENFFIVVEFHELKFY